MTSVEYSHFDGPKQVSNGLSFLVDADALITNQVDVLLSVKTADCLPIFVMGVIILPLFMLGVLALY